MFNARGEVVLYSDESVGGTRKRECFICAQDLAVGQTVVRQCATAFHAACIDRWVAQNQASNQPVCCPKCQAPWVQPKASQQKTEVRTYRRRQTALLAHNRKIDGGSGLGNWSPAVPLKIKNITGAPTGAPVVARAARTRARRSHGHTHVLCHPAAAPRPSPLSFAARPAPYGHQQPPHISYISPAPNAVHSGLSFFIPTTGIRVQRHRPPRYRQKTSL